MSSTLERQDGGVAILTMSLEASRNTFNPENFQPLVRQIESLMESSLYGDEEELVANWKFNTGQGDILYDHSGNQNHGTIVGASWEDVFTGCMDPLALNYDELAELDDGSCEYPDNGDYALSFDGLDDYVDISSIEGGLQNFSYSGWFYSIENPNQDGTNPIIGTPTVSYTHLTLPTKA